MGWATRRRWRSPAAWAGQRHAGHLDADRTGAELWDSPPRSPRAGPVLTVDTSGPVDISELTAALTRLFSTNAGT